MSQSMRICLVSREYPPDTAWGGIATYTHTLAHSLARMGHSVQVLSLSVTKNEYTEYDGAIGVDRLRPVRWFLPFALLGFPTVAAMLNYSVRVAQRLRELNLRQPFDVVEAPGYFAEAFVFSLVPSSALVVRLYTTLHDIVTVDAKKPTIDTRFACWLESMSLRRATRVAAHSQFSARKALTLYTLRPDRILVAPLGIDLPETSINDRQPDTQLQTVLSVGRLSERKGSKTLLDAVPIVIDRVPNVQFVIVGRDKPMTSGGLTYRDYFYEYVADNRSRSAVVWEDHVSSDVLDRLYKRCDIFVGPSLYETFGLIHLEAMAHGKPVVACRASATPELVADGETGILIEPGNSEELAEAIIRLLSDTSLRRSMGKAALSRARQFSAEAMAQTTLDVYRQAIKERKRQEGKHHV